MLCGTVPERPDYKTREEKIMIFVPEPVHCSLKMRRPKTMVCGAAPGADEDEHHH
jgi:hypothetical protein